MPRQVLRSVIGYLQGLDLRLGCDGRWTRCRFDPTTPRRPANRRGGGPAGGRAEGLREAPYPDRARRRGDTPRRMQRRPGYRRKSHRHSPTAARIPDAGGTGSRIVRMETEGLTPRSVMSEEEIFHQALARTDPQERA